MRRPLPAVLALVASAPAFAGTQLDPSLQLSAEERYDDDVLLRTAAGNGELITKISPQAGLALKQPNLSVDTWYALDVLYMAESEHTDVGHRARLELKDKTSERNTVTALGQIWRVTDPTSLPRLGLAVTPSPVLYGKAQVADRYELTRRFELDPSYRFEGVQVYQAGKPPGFVHVASFDDWYALSARTAVGLDYRFQWFQFGAEADHANGVFAAYRYRLSRETTFTARAGGSYWQRNGSVDSGAVPGGQLSLERQAGPWELDAELGHDLVGASGFTAVLWADFAAIATAYKFSGRLRRLTLSGAAAYFRNGYATGAQSWSLGPVADTSDGYAFHAGAEWRLNQTFALQATGDRISQLGGAVYGGGGALVRDIFAMRLVITAL